MRVLCCVQFCKAAQWEVYCGANSQFAKILRGLVTGFLPSLLITLWQVGGRGEGWAATGNWQCSMSGVWQVLAQ